ncbi:MAG TPA: creatininase family protein [Kiritimatiellia bacterium]|nr:creatininase family protein [Kiritimatiellia bacterium]
MSPLSLQLDELTSPEIRKLIADGYLSVLVPLGATEQHGPALPLCVDNAHGLETALRAARALGRTLVGPVMTLGCSPEHARFPGTVSLARETVVAMLKDIAESHARSGFRLVYFWCGHGGNFPMLQEALEQMAGRWPSCRIAGIRDIQKYVRETWDTLPLREGVPPEVSGSHAGEFETSMMLALRPELVRVAEAEAGAPDPLDVVFDTMMREGIDAVSPNGVLGDQRGADADRGRRYLDGLAAWLVRDVEKHRKELGL